MNECQYCKLDKENSTGQCLHCCEIMNEDLVEEIRSRYKEVFVDLCEQLYGEITLENIEVIIQRIADEIFLEGVTEYRIASFKAFAEELITVCKNRSHPEFEGLIIRTTTFIIGNLTERRGKKRKYEKIN